MLVSFVIPAYNAEKTIKECIAHIKSQKVKGAKIEIIVVNDGSQDRTAELAERMGARVINIPHSGKPSALNAGIRASRGELIAIVDADIYISKDWLREVLAEINRGYDIVHTPHRKGSLMKPHESLYYGILYTSFSLGAKLFGRCPEIPTVGDAVIVKREVFDKAGPFDENFNPIGGDDVEMSIRAIRHGFRAINARKANFYHVPHISKGFRNKFTKAILYNHGMIRSYLKHRDFLGNCIFSAWLPFLFYPLLTLLRRMLI